VRHPLVTKHFYKLQYLCSIVHYTFVKIKLTFFLLLICFLSTKAQNHTLYAIVSKWDDAFQEWEIQTIDEDIEASMNMRWAFKNDYTEWDFNIGDQHGSIKLKFPVGLQQWEVRIGNDIAILKQLWMNDLTQWRVTNDDVTLTFKTKWGRNPFEWELRNDDKGLFKIYSQYENDPRDWVIIDEMEEEVTLPMKVGMMFMAVFQAMPKP